MIVLLFMVTMSPFTADKVEIINGPDGSVVRLVGEVAIQTPTAKITCQEATIYEARNLAVLSGTVKIVDSNSTVEADTAYHYLQGSMSVLKRNVALHRQARSIFADSLVYDRGREQADAFGNVRMVDTVQKFAASSSIGTYDLRRGIGVMRGQPRALVDRAEKPPIEVTSKTLEYQERTNMMFARDSVAVRIDSMLITGDTLRYDINAKEGWISNIVMTEQENRVTGDAGRFELVDDQLSEFEVRSGQGTYLTREGSQNDIAGGSMLFRFSGGRATEIVVTGAPKGYLHLRQ